MRFLTSLAILACSPALLAQGPFRDLPLKDQLPFLEGTGKVLLADVDNDGHQDLFVCGSVLDFTGHTRIFHNDGEERFTEETATRLPHQSFFAHDAVFLDAENDGDLDVALVTFDRTFLWLNDGSGVFSFSVGQVPFTQVYGRTIAAGDIDSDGDADLVLGNWNPDAVNLRNLLYVNDGNGVFQNVPFPIDSADTVAIEIVDVNGDTYPDIVFGNLRALLAPNAQNMLYLNDGFGGFVDVTATNFPADDDRTYDVVSGDVDGDGDVDLFFANSNHSLAEGFPNVLYLNDGSGSFVDASGQLANNDHCTDGAALIDFDGDSDLDLVLANRKSSERNQLLLNDGAGQFSDATDGRVPQAFSRSLASGDVDGDGDVDVAFGGVRLRVQINDGAAWFHAVSENKIARYGAQIHDMSAGDLDGDGDADAVYLTRSGSDSAIELYVNDGYGSLTRAPAAAEPVGGDFNFSVALADIDGDSDLDIATGSFGPGENQLFVNDGSGAFTDVTAAQLPPNPFPTRSLAFADFDGDGDADMIVGNDSAKELLLNDGSGTFSVAPFPIVSARTVSIATADVEGDGDIDVLLGAENPGALGAQNVLLLNDGSAQFVIAPAGRLPARAECTQAVAFADVDGDSDPDIVVGNQTQPDRLLLNDGTGVFTDAPAANWPDFSEDTAAVVIGDVDADGDLDVYLGSSDVTFFSGQSDHLLLNDGAGGFTKSQAGTLPDEATPGGATIAAVMADLDLDGDQDLLRADFARRSVWTNLDRQIEAPLLARAGNTYRFDYFARPGRLVAPVPAVIYFNPVPQVPRLPSIFGLLGVALPGLVTLPSVVLSAPGGEAATMLTIPATTGIDGLPLFFQGLMIQNSGEFTFTNVLADRVDG